MISEQRGTSTTEQKCNSCSFCETRILDIKRIKFFIFWAGTTVAPEHCLHAVVADLARVCYTGHEVPKPSLNHFQYLAVQLREIKRPHTFAQLGQWG